MSDDRIKQIQELIKKLDDLGASAHEVNLTNMSNLDKTFTTITILRDMFEDPLDAYMCVMTLGMMLSKFKAVEEKHLNPLHITKDIAKWLTTKPNTKFKQGEEKSDVAIGEDGMAGVLQGKRRELSDEEKKQLDHAIDQLRGELNKQ